MEAKLIPRQQKRRRARKLARFYGILTVFVFSVYFLAGFFLHPLFLVSDIREKIRAVADTVNVLARVLNPPVKPVVTATSVCVSGNPAVILDWADDENSVSYDITRDGFPLSTGVVASEYTDTAVTLGQAYSYVVTALGPMGPGFSDADSVSVSAPGECTAVIVPSILFQTFAGKNISGTTERHFTTDRNPRVTGVTNIANARVELLIESESEVIRTTVFANINGYFEWRYEGKLDFATYTLTATAIDQGNPAISVSGTLKISIESAASQDVSKQKAALTAENVSEAEKVIQTRPDFDFSLQLAERELYAGDTVHATIIWQHLSDELIGTEGEAFFQLIDGDGKITSQFSQAFIFARDTSLEQGFIVPYGMVDKDYRVRVEVRVLSYRVFHEEILRILPLPLLQLGSTTMTYEQAVSHIGWISFLILFLFLWWLLLFLREYFLYLQSTRSLTGKDLHVAGYF